LTANPVAGWSFSEWSGDISGSVNPKSIIVNGTTSVTATFVVTGLEYGMLRVYSDPAVQTTIFVNNVPRDDWGLNWLKLAPGEYTIHFSDVPGFATPANQTVTVTTDETTTVTGNFIRYGYLHVTTNSPSLPYGVNATISIDGKPRNDWGAWLPLTPGMHIVQFGDVANYITPPDQQPTVVAGTSVTASGNYVPGTKSGPTGFGLLRVQTNPAVISSIYVNNVVMNDWGLDWVKLAPDSYMLLLSDVPGYLKPTQVKVRVYAFGSDTPISDTMVNYLTDPIPIYVNKVTEVLASFTQLGYLHVITNPPLGVNATIYIDGAARDDWGVWLPLTPGPYTVHFGDVAGFIAPADQQAIVEAGKSIEKTGNYVAGANPGPSGFGLLRVVTNPPVGSTIYVNNVPMDDWGVWVALAPGDYVVSFGDVSGYTTPTPQSVTVTAGKTPTVVTGEY